ncbi:hypothetical protein LTR86_008084 [Recurvomyces mirabilis]|nr:hypothetical protein LTR86_008084 [Recurvomyces mirabilis]
MNGYNGKMESSSSLPWMVGFLLLTVALGCFLVYRSLLPKPISGIPYNHDAANRLLGDVPEAMQHIKETEEMMTFLTTQIERHNTPIVQVFMRPGGKPWVILSDFRESQDILVRRTREFDRSDFFGDLFISVLPANQVHMRTNDTWRAHRRLMADTMSTAFLNKVAARQIYGSALEIVGMWREKARLADGRPFQVYKDVFRGALDVIWAVTFGSEVGTTRNQRKYLSDLKEIEVSTDVDAPVDLPMVQNPEAFEAIMTLGESCEIPMKSPFPRLHHAMALRFYPRYVSARKTVDRLLTDSLRSAWVKFTEQGASEGEIRSALDLMVEREVVMAKKAERKPAYDTQDIRDELLGFLFAGHETTSTTLTWGLKFMTTKRDVQQKLRGVLQAQFQRAHVAKANPTVEEIVAADIPYLDAVIEEIHRCGGTASSNVRVATEDAVVLGHLIPKGTSVFMLCNGPGYKSQPIAIEEFKRSKTSQENVRDNVSWDPNNANDFLPERWLVADEKGHLVFEPRAGPNQPFGAGPRGCFGRKLASLELKILIILFVWNFDLQPTPPALSSFAGHDGMTHSPQQCFLRLKPLP